MLSKHVLLNALLPLVFLFTLKLALAALPSSLNYQGHLTDNAGVPIDGPVNMAFALYNTQTSTTALWSDSRPVTIDQGVFSVELGAGSNPFPLGLFEQPLWLGLTIGTDAEMTPRRPISSTAFSFKADDANTLEGVSAGTLDQSAHVIDTANPHGITTTQIGAADAAALSAHAGATSNPHSVTAAQTGAASSSDFTTHTSNSAAHHSRFTSGEAVAAMGTKNDGNPLHHDKYSDANVVTAMLASDGAGSTLDSDKIDGLEASELIDAAQDEVRTPISALPYTINALGSYYVTGNLDGSAGGIDITTDNVTLDLMGFTLNGGGSVSDYGINFTGRSNISIRNGFITGFGLAGIYQGNSDDRFATILDVQVTLNGTQGIESWHSGIYLSSSNSHIERCVAGYNGGYGIYANDESKLINNTAHYNNGFAGIAAGTGSTLSGNTAYSNNYLYGIYGGSATILINNTADSNSNTGIFGYQGASLSNNTARSNTGDGIRASYGTTVSGNTSHSNNGVGIHSEYGVTLTGNTVYDNAAWGIYAYDGSLIMNNTITSNNTSNTTGKGGLRVNYDNRVVGNTLDGNIQNNIYVTGSDNSLENNLVTDSVNGIFFNMSGNFYGNNRAAGNTTNFNLNSTTQTTNTYLPNIGF